MVRQSHTSTQFISTIFSPSDVSSALRGLVRMNGVPTFAQPPPHPCKYDPNVALPKTFFWTNSPVEAEAWWPVNTNQVSSQPTPTHYRAEPPNSTETSSQVENGHDHRTCRQGHRHKSRFVAVKEAGSHSALRRAAQPLQPTFPVAAGGRRSLISHAPSLLKPLSRPICNSLRGLTRAAKSTDDPT